jgi:cytochrome c oxidase cbb3-type subunit 3
VKPLSAILIGAMALSACNRESRTFRPEPAHAATDLDDVALTSFAPGGIPRTMPRDPKAEAFLGNAYDLSQGKTLFKQMNCNGCHANGGGDSGPALMDDRWIYGGAVENVAASIREGRPNGMPSFRGKLTEHQIRQLAAYVLSMSGNASSSAAPQRDDAMNPHPSESRQSTRPPVGANVPTP